MKLLTTLLLITVISASAQDGLRTFTAADGRTLKARIVSMDPSLEKIQIQREDGKKLTVSPASFSEKDQSYIKRWQAAWIFQSSSDFKLDLKRATGDTSKKEHNVDVGNTGGRRGDSGMMTVAIDKRTKYSFDLTLQNKSPLQLNNISIEYRLFYNQEKPVLDEKANKDRPEDSQRPERYLAVDEPKVKEGKARLKPAEPDSSRTVSTAAVTLLERSAGRAWGDKIDLKSSLSGAWIRLSMKGPDGDVLTRDITSSNTIMKKFSWDTPEEQLVQENPQAAN